MLYKSFRECLLKWNFHIKINFNNTYLNDLYHPSRPAPLLQLKRMRFAGHILDLVLIPVGVDLVNRVEVSPIDHRISNHALITFELDVFGPATYSKKITFRSYRGLNVREATSIIEDDLVSAVAESQTSVQRVDFYNRGFTSLRDQFCSLVTKEIRVRDDAGWYDHRVVSLLRERRRAERRWRRIGSGAARTLYVPARRAVVKQIYICKIEYYQRWLPATYISFLE